MKPLHTLLFWTGVAALFAALGAPAAALGAVEVKRFDASDYPRVEVTVVTSRPSFTPPRLRENGQPAAGVEADNVGRAKSVVVAVDRSQSMDGVALERAVAAARAFIASKPRRDRLAVVGIGPEAVLLSRFSTSTIDADIALRTLGVSEVQGTALNDAVALAGRQLREESMPARVLVLLTDGNEVGSSTTEKGAIAAARRSGVAVYVIGIESARFNPAPLRRLAEETGGNYFAAAGPEAIANAYAAVAWELRKTWRVRWMTRARPGDDVRLEASVGGSGSATLDEKLPGSAPVQTEPSKLVPEEAYLNPLGALVVGLATGFLVLLAFVFLIAAKRGSWVRNRLAPHVGARRPTGRGRAKDRFAAGRGLVDATERSLGELNVWRKVHRLLDRAAVPLRTGEFLYIAVGAGFFLGLLAAVSGQSSPVILAAMLGGGALPFGWVSFRARRRLKAFDNQLPDLLLTIAASLKAGHSFKQGLQTVVDEGLPPASEEFQRVLADVRLGRPMDEALREMAERISSKNLEFVITSVTIQTQVGGSLAGLFDMVAEAVRQRQQFARKIRGLTAMGRASAYVLVGLPFLIALAITVLNPEYMEPLYHTSAGHTLIIVGLSMMAFGSLILKKIVSFRG
jgi:tight adherence protein B